MFDVGLEGSSVGLSNRLLVSLHRFLVPLLGFTVSLREFLLLADRLSLPPTGLLLDGSGELSKRHSPFLAGPPAVGQGRPCRPEDH